MSAADPAIQINLRSGSAKAVRVGSRVEAYSAAIVRPRDIACAATDNRFRSFVVSEFVVVTATSDRLYVT